MPAFTASAPGKIILLGEHAVVYGYPAIAVPVNRVRAKAYVMANIRAAPGEVRIEAPDVGMEAKLSDMPAGDPLAAAARGVFTRLGVENPPSCTIRIVSTIPVAAGLGSGAAVSVAIIRALSAFLGHPLPDVEVSSITYEVEKIHHGTPSGIDNHVVTYASPVYFIKGRPIRHISISKPFTMVIADTGIPSPTAQVVGDVRRAWQTNQSEYDSLFRAIGKLAKVGRRSMSRGRDETLGSLMDENHELLSQLDVSSTDLDVLVNTAREAGALGAKLSGAGRGGNMIALVPPGFANAVADALLDAGAVRTMITTVGG